MLKKTFTFTDYNGTERTEDHYFNLSKAEILELELSVDGGVGAKIERIVSAQSAPEIFKTFKELILLSYGVKSADGRRFIKNQEIRDDFVQTEAYSQLVMELATDDKAGANFLQGIMPKDIVDELPENLQDKLAVN